MGVPSQGHTQFLYSHTAVYRSTISRTYRIPVLTHSCLWEYHLKDIQDSCTHTQLSMGVPSQGHTGFLYSHTAVYRSTISRTYRIPVLTHSSLWEYHLKGIQDSCTHTQLSMGVPSQGHTGFLYSHTAVYRSTISRTYRIPVLTHSYLWEYHLKDTQRAG